MAIISNEKLLQASQRIVDVEGDFVEIGVFRGGTFKRLSLMAGILGRKAHAMDSFEGMAPPTDKDGGEYEAGKLSVGGVAAFQKIMDNEGVPESYYALHSGFIPDCFDTFDPKTRIAFCVVDVDQYQPTVTALQWAWERLNYGGVMVLDDYFPGRSVLATLAIDEWLTGLPPHNGRIFDYHNTQLFVEKLFTTSHGVRYDDRLYRA